MSFMRMRKRCGLRWFIFIRVCTRSQILGCPSMNGLEFARIEEDERLALERDFSKKVV